VKALLVGASPTDHSIITSCQNGHGRACKALRRWFNSTRRVQISESKSLVDVLARNQAAAGSIPASPTRCPSVGHWPTTCFGSTLNGVRFTALGPICWKVAQWQSTELDNSADQRFDPFLSNQTRRVTWCETSLPTKSLLGSTPRLCSRSSLAVGHGVGPSKPTLVRSNRTEAANLYPRRQIRRDAS
jgi:hypothetical protein